MLLENVKTIKWPLLHADALNWILVTIYYCSHIQVSSNETILEPNGTCLNLNHIVMKNDKCLNE